MANFSRPQIQITKAEFKKASFDANKKLEARNKGLKKEIKIRESDIKSFDKEIKSLNNEIKSLLFLFLF